MSTFSPIRRRAINGTCLTAIGLLAIGTAGTAAAQTATPASGAGPATTVEEIIVTGTRGSLRSAIDRKRTANTTVDSIVAEDVSQFPDKNVGEALQRVTGVSLTRDLGEGSQISIRGVEPDLNRVEINGLSVLNNNGTGARGASFQELASELIASIDVFKGFTADMTEGGVGGTVSIRTRRPLDLTRPLFSASASGQYFDLLETTKFRGNITAGTKFLDDRLGVIVNVTRDENDTRGDFLRGTNWIRFPTTVGTSGATLGVVTASGDYDNSPDRTFVNPDFASATSKALCPTDASTASGRAAIQNCLAQWNDFVPAIPRYGLWFREDQRTSANLSTQFRVNDALSVFVDYTVNDRQQHLTDFNYTVDASSQSRLNATTYGRNGQAITTAGNLVATVDADHNVVGFNTAARATSGTAGAANIFSTQNREFDFSYRSEYLSGGFQYKGDNLTLDGVFARTTGAAYSDSNSVTFNASIPNIRVDISDRGVPSFTFPTGFSPADPATYGIFANNGTGTNFATTAVVVNYEPSETDTFEDTAKLDLDYNFDSGFFTKFESGYQYRSAGTLQYSVGGYTRPDGTIVQGARARHNLVLTPGATANGTTLFNPLTLPPTYNTPYTQANLIALLRTISRSTPTNFYQGGRDDPGVALPNGWFAPSYGLTATGANLDLSLFDRENIRRSPGYTAAGVLVGEFDQPPALDVVEDVHAAYAQASWAGELWNMPISGNFGVRYTNTILNATGAYLQRETVDNLAIPGTTITRNLGTTITTLNNEYEDWLPTFNVALDVTDKIVARFGYAKVLARPNPTFLVPAATCTFNRTAVGLVDDLEDVCSAGNPALEPYRADQFDLNIGWFQNRDTLFNAGFFYKNIESFVVGPVVVQNVDLFGDGTLFDVTQRINGNGAKIQGVELSAQTAFTFLPSPFDGFGGIINYTYSEAKDVGLFSTLTQEELPFPGLSTHTYNIIGYYDKGPINARLAYNGRSGYLQTAIDARGNPVYRDKTGYLDGRAAYKLSNQLTVFIEARNMTGENERSTNGSVRLVEDVYSGKRYFAGLTFRY
ncbi:MAG: TonB-dependent receptor [Alphaproteobacteria bacterium]|nr:MAG: TonB-dependent receptor [Alphaproteobacteria bacterium]PZO40456.1 MAG: TonB-dependent receptor [Alphaproteobacteria bacterium]